MMRFFFRILLIFVLLFLGIRYLLAILFPKKSADRVSGKPRKKSGRIDEDRIQDAHFKDIPKP
jgi:hypothetical protein